MCLQKFTIDEKFFSCGHDLVCYFRRENILKFITPSSELRSASPLKGEAVTCVSLAHFTASPLRGEAARRADEGGKKNKINKPSVLLYN